MKKGGAGTAKEAAAAVGQVKAELEDVGKAAGRAVAVAAAAALSPLSETLWREKAAVEFLGDVSARLAWRDLTVTVALGSGDTQAVLQALTGYAEPGTITALMGPSGLKAPASLDALAGRLAANAFLSGTILLNGRKANLSFGAVAYVTQDDNLIGTLTVRETISYSARLRLPDNMPMEEKRALVEGTIVEMGLQDCADTVIGNWHLRGVSGGEKRRVSIALEILMRPRLLFLDEPTSGLDSASAFFVTQTLRGLARDGRTVIASIHQPSSEVFELFDRLYLLSGGKTVYFGQASEACEFFAQAGFPCPPLRNPSDHFLRCINADFDKVKATLKGSMKMRFERSDDPLERITTSDAIRRLFSYYQHSQHYLTARQKVDEMARLKGTVLDAGGEPGQLWDAGLHAHQAIVRQHVEGLWVLLAEACHLHRGHRLHWVHIPQCRHQIQLHPGTGRVRVLHLRLRHVHVDRRVPVFRGGHEGIPEGAAERALRRAGVLAFVISNTLSAMPFLILITFLSGTLCYFMVRLHPGFMHYVFFLLCLYASVTVVESLMMAIASIIPNFLMGIIIGAGIQGIFMLVSGYFRLPHDIPKPFWRYPMSYISFHYWALQGQYQNDLVGLVFDNQDEELPKIPGEYILENVFQIDVSRSKWLDLSVLFGMIVIYRLLFFAMIKVSEDVTPWVRGYMARRRVQHKRREAELAMVRTPSLRGYVVDAAPELPADHP
ncbi:hypothetical protein CFC21_011243 [Triticum aestivum]|uniref:ABC transporter domain-containing protein n=2 Tax=Triticum aestivum TaxID=4565 RepID=A0A3B5ZSM1_WHEAT|nr:hypothetical protein CFC21_011243 [Triticum aestivum]